MTHRKGILLAGGTGSRLHPLTIATSKQLMPVYDKPMIYYPLSVLMLAGIRDILIITTPEDRPAFKKLLGNGQQWGIHLSYAEQAKPEGLAQAFVIGESFLQNAPAALILGDNLFYGNEFAQTVIEANRRADIATIFGYHVGNPQRYGVVEFSTEHHVLSLEEKPLEPKSNFAVPGIYFFPNDVAQKAKTLTPSARGEYEITDLSRLYLKEKKLEVKVLGRGTAWLDTGTHNSLLDAANFVQIIEKRQGLKIACLEEIAYKQGWCSRKALLAFIKNSGNNSYTHYVESMLLD